MTIIASLLGQARLPDSPTPRLDAELLLAAALGKPRSYLHTWPERVVSGDVAERYASFLERRRSGEPVERAAIPVHDRLRAIPFTRRQVPQDQGGAHQRRHSRPPPRRLSRATIVSVKIALVQQHVALLEAEGPCLRSINSYVSDGVEV